MSKKSKYAGQDFSDDVQKQASNRDGGGCNFKLPSEMEIFKAKKGTIRLNIIPYIVSIKDHPVSKKGSLYYMKKYKQHAFNLAGDMVYEIGRASCRERV